MLVSTEGPAASSQNLDSRGRSFVGGASRNPFGLGPRNHVPRVLRHSGGRGRRAGAGGVENKLSLHEVSFRILGQGILLGDGHSMEGWLTPNNFTRTFYFNVHLNGNIEAAVTRPPFSRGNRLVFNNWTNFLKKVPSSAAFDYNEKVFSHH